MKTEQDKINNILDRLTPAEMEAIEQSLEAIPSFVGHGNYVLTEEQRAVMTKQAAQKYKELFDILKLDYKTDPNLKSTPIRISSMLVNELIVGRFQEAPRIESFPADASLANETLDLESGEIDMPFNHNGDMEVEIVNACGQEIIISKRVDVQSLCSHHFMPFFNNDSKSYAVIAYKPSKLNTRFLGISKLQRIVEFYAARPQLQENLTQQIYNHICRVLGHTDVFVCMKNLTHTCESLRGVRSVCGRTSTILYGGIFKDSRLRAESLHLAV